MERLLRPLPLLALAFVLRAGRAIWTATLAADGTFHLSTARGFLDGGFGELLGTYRLHPLNPILSGLFGAVLGGVEAGGMAAAAVFSSLALLPLHALARRFWSERIAGWAGLLYALHPTLIDEGSEVLNTGTYLFFFLSALAAGLFALQSRRLLLFALCGAACGLLYLTRPEGLLVPLALVAMAAGRLRDRRIVGGMALAAAAALLVSAPYLLWLRGHYGRWTLTPRQAAAILVSNAPAPPPDEDRSTASKLARTVLKAQLPWLLPFLAAGLALGKRLGGSRRTLAWAAALALASVAPSILLLLKSGVPPSHRYFLPAVSLLLPWTAAGWIALRDLAGRWGWLPVALLAASLLAKGVGPRRAEESTLREAGFWIRGLRLPPGEVLVSRGEKIAWYAGMRPGDIGFRSGPEGAVKDVLAALKTHRAEFFALDAKSRSRYMTPDAEAELEKAGLTEVAVFDRPGRVRVAIYRLQKSTP